jgi:hypothetical protein
MCVGGAQGGLHGMVSVVCRVLWYAWQKCAFKWPEW